MGRRVVIAPGAIRKVVFIRFSSLGDVVLATSAVRSVKARFPQSEITFLTKQIYRPLLETHPDIFRVEGIETARSRSNLWSLARLCRSLGPFDVVVDLHQSIRSRLSRRLIPASRRIGYRKQILLRRLWALGLLREKMQLERRHVVDRYLEALRPLGVDPNPLCPEIFIDPEEIESAAEFLRSKGVRDPRRTAVLFPGAKWPNKRWVTEGFSAVGEQLRSEMGLEAILAGDAADIDCARKVWQGMSGEVTDITGETPLRQLAAILKLARVAVGNDSGPGHIAAAVGTPVVAVFGPTAEVFGFTPRGERVGVVSLPLDCRPCTIHGGSGCRRGKRSCLEDIGPENVMEAVRAVLVSRG